MSFVREKEIPPGSGNRYLYEVESQRQGDKVIQKHIRYIGRTGGGGGSGRLGTTAHISPSMSMSESHLVQHPVKPVATPLGTTDGRRSIRVTNKGKFQVLPMVATSNDLTRAPVFDTQAEAEAYITRSGYKLDTGAPVISRPELVTTPKPQSDTIAIKAKQIFDTTRPDPRFGGTSLTPIQRATLPEIEAHLRLVDKIGREFNKTLDPGKYPLGTTEDELRDSAKIYWTQGRRIQAAKTAKYKTETEQDLIYEARKIHPNSSFLDSLLDQIGRRHRLSAKQREAVEKMIKGA